MHRDGALLRTHTFEEKYGRDAEQTKKRQHAELVDGKLPAPGVVRTSGIGLLGSGVCGEPVCCTLAGPDASQKSETKKPLNEKSNLSRLRVRPLDLPIAHLRLSNYC